MFAGWVNRSQQDVIDYLQAENWVLRDQLGDKRFAGGQSTTLADVQRSYNALSPTSMAYKPFHNQLSKAAFGRFMQELASHVLSTLMVEVLKPSRAGLLAEFGRVLTQDGSSFAVKDALRRSYPGRFTTVSPAAVELQVSWNLCRESIEQVVSGMPRVDYRR